MRMFSGSRLGDRRWAWPAAAVCAIAGLAVFQLYGNATRGYINSASLFRWWMTQWIDPRAETQHGWLILAIAAWLLVRSLRNKDANSEPDREGATWPALAALLVGLGLQAAGFVAQQTRMSVVAGLIFAWGVLRLGGGKRWGDAARFPLAFLVFAIPLNVLDSLGFWLRLWVIDAAEVIARAAHIAVWRSGTQLFAADGRYQYDVAAACSGVRSLMALAALSLLIGYLEFRSTWRRVAMLLLCFPLTYLGNVVRIAAIVFAAQLGGQSWGERAHDVMGFGVFAIVLGGVLWAARALTRFAPEPPGQAQSNTLCYTVPGSCAAETPDPASTKSAECNTLCYTPEEGAAGSAVTAPGTRAECNTMCYTGSGAEGRWGGRLGGAGVMAAVAGAIAGLAVGEMFFLGRLAERAGDGAAGVRLAADGVNPVELPAFVGTEWIGRRAEVTAVEREILPADTGFSRRSYANVGGGGHTVFVSIVLSGRDRTSIHRPELCLVGQGWTLEAEETRRLQLADGEELPVTVLRTERVEPRTGRRIPAVVVYWFVNADAVVATHWERVGRDAWNRLFQARADRWAYVLVQADAADGEAAALGRVREVLGAAVPVFQQVK